MHGTERTHAAVGLVRTSLEQFDLARRFFGAGKQATQHYGMRTSGQRFGDIAGIADAAVSDQRHAAVFQGFCHIVNGGDLRHADAGDDARGTDRSRDRYRP